MRTICYLIAYLHRGGTERRMARLAVNGDWQSEVVVLHSRGSHDDDPSLVEMLGRAGVPVQRLGLGRLKTPAGLLRLGLVARSLRTQLKSARPDILHAFLPSTNLLAVMTAPRGLPVVITQGALGIYRENSRLLARLENRFYPRADAVLCNSEAVRRDLLKNIPAVEAEKCTVVHNGIELPDSLPNAAERASRRRELLGIGPDHDQPFVFVMLANLIPYKGHDLAFEALAACRDRSRLRLVIVGADPLGWRENLDRLAGRLGIASRIHFAGPQPDPGPWLTAADALLSSSHEEGFSNSILEGMAHGLPVVATRVGGTPEAFPSDYPHLVEPENAAALAEAMDVVAADRTAAAAWGRRLAERARAEFSIGRMCAEVGKLYDRLLRNRPCTPK